MGLIHMNGRVEDANIGRFLSPDPYVQDALNTQSFNRYSYVNNNPLTFTDPSGFECFDDGTPAPAAPRTSPIIPCLPPIGPPRTPPPAPNRKVPPSPLPAQSPQPPHQTPMASQMPMPCDASRLNNPDSANNGRIGFLLGGTIAMGGTLVLLNAVGFPEVEAAESVLGAGYLLGLASAVGDAPLVAVSAGSYGALVGTGFGVGITSPMCSSQSPPGP